MSSQIFGLYGQFCATHPWEVIVLVLTFTTTLLTVDKRNGNNNQILNDDDVVVATPSLRCTGGCFEERFKAVDVIIMTIIRCVAILYTSHQFRNLQKLGSKYVLGIAGLFTVFSSFVFTSTVLNLLQIDLVDLKDALFFFLLLIDLSKAATLAQFALTASTQEEIPRKIARGMAILGPTITLDTVVETLVIGVGTLSGVYRLEMLSYFACLSVLVNYVIFMTFYPACLSLILELSRISSSLNDDQTLMSAKMLLEENEKANPAVQRVKLIMSIGLLFVHIHSRWFLIRDSSSPFTDGDSIVIGASTNCTEDIDTSSLYGYLMQQFTSSADHIVILILVITLMVKFVFFENEPTLILHHNEEKEEEKMQEQLDNNKKSTIHPILRRQDRIILPPSNENTSEEENDSIRNLEDCLEIYRSGHPSKLTDNEIILLVDTKHIPAYNLEKALNNYERGVRIRRRIIQNTCPNVLTNLPYLNYDYTRVMGVCCENVIGYVPVPLGVAGPLHLDGNYYNIPMSTTEGCLVASTNRGCRVVERSGVRSRIVADGMTRGPVVRFVSIIRASEVLAWLNDTEVFRMIKQEFDATSRFARLSRISARIAGRYLYIRFVAQTGDAMGMNMLSKGTEKSLRFIQEQFPDMEIMSLSGNYCTDKKPSAVNWIEGRGKSVVCEAVIGADVITTMLKTTTEALIDLNISKNMIGSAMAGSIGGFNAHAANIVTAIYIATGQDPAQNVGSSNCITLMERCGVDGRDLHVSCTMPSIEIGTVGGGTALPAQSACLEMLGVRGANEQCPGENAKQLSRIVCAAVLVGELSLMGALATGSLVKSHLKLNRSIATTTTMDNDGSQILSETVCTNK